MCKWIEKRLVTNCELYHFFDGNLYWQRLLLRGCHGVRLLHICPRVHAALLLRSHSVLMWRVCWQCHVKGVRRRQEL